MMKVVNEMPRGRQKKLTKQRAYEIAKDVMMKVIGTAYYNVEEGSGNPKDDYNLTKEELELVYKCLTDVGNKIGKCLGREYISY